MICRPGKHNMIADRCTKCGLHRALMRVIFGVIRLRRRDVPPA